MRAFPMQTVLRLGAIAACATLSVTASAQAQTAPRKTASAAPQSNWATHSVVMANGTHRLGNPEAPVKLVEYVSYTCSHCAHFHTESTPVLKTTVVPKGQVSIAIHNVLRNPIDLTIAMLTNCGDPKGYFMRHNYFLDTQDTWFAKVKNMNQAQQARWYQGPLPTRMKAIASDFGFYTRMESWGTSRAQTDACFANEATLNKLQQQQQDVQAVGITGTPSITMNGTLLDVNDWSSVSRAITGKLSELRAGNI